MDRARRSGSTTLLIGIGLVLVGLLAGILVMLFVFNGSPAAPATPQFVERIELGRPVTPAPRLTPDPEVPANLPDPVSLNRLFKAVAGQVTPAVVYIQVRISGEDEEGGTWLHNFDRFRDRLPRESVGSGVIISDKGYIVTNHHVVEGADEITVLLTDKRQFVAEIVGTDPNTDLAVIRVEDAVDLPVIAFGDSDAIEVGEWVLAVGNPFRLTSTVTAGIVSALGRQVNIIEDSFGIEDFIQTDAAINPGNSGGALVNLNGELVGISTAIATESGSYEGYGFAVPVNLMERIVRDLIAFGEVQRGFLGVEIGTIDAGRAEQLGLERIEGVFLNNVWRGGAAYKGGLRSGDVVVAIGPLGINAPNELQSAIARYRPGDRLPVEVLRNGERRRFEVVLFGREDPAYETWFSELNPEAVPESIPEVGPDGLPPGHPEVPEVEVIELESWGVGLRPLSRRERDAFDVAEGAYIAYVENSSVAATAGLPRDVVILRVGGTPVRSMDEAIAAFETATDEALLLHVKRRNGLSAFFEIEVPHVAR